MRELNSQIAVVTGAGRGIGKAIALCFAEAGAQVICLSRTLKNAETTANAIRDVGGQASSLALDVSSGEETRAVIDSILHETGRVDILVNNAGVTQDDLLMRMSEEAWDNVLDTNLKGAFNLCRALARPLMKQRSGRILNISSVIGLMGNAGQSNYAASKAGLIGLTKSIARELAPRNITCNAIAPGFIETDMTAGLTEEQKKGILQQVPLKQLGQPRDIALAALYLAGPGGRYITGQVLTVDGGMVMH
ncbi:MAG: 3-oxoacyl-[acyl-carrier-protein] reductase [Verrucomicrobiota bacterium]|nr:3-oxoacyl-[acyl-carrier-protein] reductase [Verrucomicrobiota bacterium]